MGDIEQAAKSVEKADRAMTHKAAAHRDTPIVKATGFLAEIGDQPQLVATSLGTVVIGLVARRPDMIRGGVRMFAAHAAATFVKSAIKSSIDRTRPEKAIEDGKARFEPGDSDDHAQTSFPSGHTAGAVAVARAVSRDIDGAGAPAALVTGVVAAAQPLNGKHYLSDLVVGAAVGWIAEALVSAVFDRVAPVIENAAVEKLPLLDAPATA
ncbi:phosphatase PAP2 family protein [Sphingomonas faeni]|uniref:phosphatase PAP2 family protein n=1 Tax=Sphingomonas faeni TaxID=185950 RepID=UPI0020C74BF2|nr:phosphatase PAP2 family protein [Sphingomonas faeni]MCP8890548.1 phosphatase PAP2 family protein [Sphingomonas faeni]